MHHPYFGINTRQELKRMFPNKWIDGRGGPVLFPARSPDLTCLNYYLWGRVKELAYFQRPIISENMKERIKNIFSRNNNSRVRRSPSKLPTKTGMSRSTCRTF
ncbi:hypothetical protein ALC60_14021 [Trachymyrmex zeteki]|uniref:DUF4817 domain-containing protein n=1 Tax=Mycetomoellerius zeteki TaxID=64791 RepID=A0A151WGH5_9HYME|nr:hypothetical protein ALC60_14021 [Trachymyrmex zeteki]